MNQSSKWFLFLIVLIGITLLSSFRVKSQNNININTSAVVSSTAVLTQSNYRWYANEDALTPTSALVDENNSTSTLAIGGILRLRINLVAGETIPVGTTIKLQYSDTLSGSYLDLSTSTAWIFQDNPSVADGQIIIDNLLSNSNVGESYGESNPSAASPSAINATQYGEWDWVLKNNSANRDSNWYFRVIYSSGTILSSYNRYPTLIAASSTTPGGGGGSSGSTGGGSNSGGSSGYFPSVETSSSTYPDTKPKPRSPCDNIKLQIVDLNADCRVDIVDLSILLYYYKKSGTPILRYDFNNNGIVDFPDISIMMYYWTK
jgi:hypothetical protein